MVLQGKGIPMQKTVDSVPKVPGFSYHETHSYQHFSTLREAAKAALSDGVKLDVIESLVAMRLTRFLDIIDKAGMRSELQAMPVVTIYAPTNYALNALSDEDKADFLKDQSSHRRLVEMH